MTIQETQKYSRNGREYGVCVGWDGLAGTWNGSVYAARVVVGEIHRDEIGRVCELRRCRAFDAIDRVIDDWVAAQFD